MRPPRVLVISDFRALEASGQGSWREQVATLGASEALAFQLREKHLDDRQLYDLAREVAALLPPSVALWINGRPDIAEAVGAAGVHLPSRGLPVDAVRRRFGERLGIGRSTHSLEEVAQARDQGASYVTFGPVYETPSKRPFGPPQGLEALRRAARLGIPVLAVGGLSPQRFREAAAAGAHGVAGIRMFFTPEGRAEARRQAERAFHPPTAAR